MIRKFSFFVTILLFPFFCLSQKDLVTEITFYIKYAYSDDSSYTKTIPVGFDLFYPMYQPVTKWVDLKRGRTTTTVKVGNNSISIDGSFLVVENGDTLYTKVEKRNGHITFGKQNNPLLFYSKIWQADFAKKNSIYPTSKLDDPNFSFNSYKDFCHEYFTAEQIFIDTFFKNNRIGAKERLLNSSKNNELTALITPFINGKLSDSKLRIQMDSIIQKEIVRLDHLQSGYILDPSYRNVLSNINLFQANIIVEGEITPIDYNVLYDNAIDFFSKDAYTFLLISYLRRIVRSSNGNFKFIADKIYNHLNTLSLNKKAKHQIDSIYKDFDLLITNIKLFQDVYLKNSKGQSLKFKTALDDQRPILLDFWATWCAPCLAEFPYLDTLRKAVPDLQIITLSIDKDESKWVKFMKRNQVLDNSSYLIINPDKSLIVQKYKIGFVPRYILYDKHGNCLSFDFLRPSEKAFIETIKKNLETK